MSIFNLSHILLILTIIIQITYTALDCCSCRTTSSAAGGSALCKANNPNNECQILICVTGDPRFIYNPDPYCCNNRWDGTCVNEANIICSDTPSPIPASPVPAPTHRPTFLFEKCIDEWPLFGGEGWLSIDTDHISKKFLMKIHGPATKWFGVGFGKHSMNDTYAVVTSDSILTVKERILSHHAMGTEQTPSFIQFAHSEINGKREIQFIRDYDNIFDFSDWFNCNIGNKWLNIISAIGSGLTFSQHLSRFNTDSLWSCLCSTDAPTGDPTSDPSIDPTSDPTNDPTFNPTKVPTTDPSIDPTSDPSTDPTSDPTNDPTFNPTTVPTTDPSIDPTSDPSTDPTIVPTYNPTTDPSIDPTIDPTSNPTINPSTDPTYHPTIYPTIYPTSDPTIDPTQDPTTDPTVQPTFDPTIDPTSDPTADPSKDPTTYSPTSDPTQIPTLDPTFTYNPTEVPTKSTNAPSTDPTIDPTKDPTFDPTTYPTTYPTTDPTLKPTIYRSNDPTTEPTYNPTIKPTYYTSDPSVDPTRSTAIYSTESTQSIADKEGVTVIRKETKITVGFEDNLLWFLLILLLPCLCIICCILPWFWYHKYYKKKKTETPKTTTTASYNYKQTELSNKRASYDDGSTDKSSKDDNTNTVTLPVGTGNNTNHNMGNKTVMAMIDVIKDEKKYNNNTSDGFDIVKEDEEYDYEGGTEETDAFDTVHNTHIRHIDKTMIINPTMINSPKHFKTMLFHGSPSTSRPGSRSGSRPGSRPSSAPPSPKKYECIDKMRDDIDEDSKSMNLSEIGSNDEEIKHTMNETVSFTYSIDSTKL